MSARFGIFAALAVGVLVAALAVPAEAQYRRNQFGPTGAMCRAACGPDCPDSCRRLRYAECGSPRQYRLVDRYTCGTHQGCRDHDYCLDNCAAGGVGQTGMDCYIAECNRECHELAVGWAMSRFGRREGMRNVTSWAGGGGPYSGEMTFEYTVDSPNGSEDIRGCPACTTCEDGQCVVLQEEACLPCQSCGDVHIRSLDGLRYDFQSSGDFILVDSPDGVRIEARQLPRGRGVSVNSAMGARLGGQVVRVWLQPSPGVEIDGRALAGPSPVPVALAGGGELRWNEDAVTMRAADGWRVSVRLFRSLLNVGVVPPEAMRGRLDGLLGDADGDPDNDLRGRDGTRYPTDLGLDALYDGFGASWRLHPDQSLLAGLPWPESVPKRGSGRPPAIATLASLDPVQRWEAEAACRDAGLEGQPNFDACVLDFAMTGDPDMIDSAVLSARGSRDVQLRRQARASRPMARGEVAVEGPARALAGARIEVAVTGDLVAGDLVALVPVTPAEPPPPLNTVRVGDGEALGLLVPPESGAYRLAYLRYPGGEVRADQPFEVLPMQVALRAPERVPAGSRIEVVAEGEGHHTDLVVIARPDAPLEHLGNHARRGRGDAVDIRVPSLPGKYELRYLIDQRRQLVARRPIEVDPLRLSLEAPASAIAGSPLTVRLVGEANPGDLVVIVAEGAPDDATTVNARVRRGDIELRLPRLPLEPGRYEVRYLIDRGRVVVARRPLRIDPPAP